MKRHELKGMTFGRLTAVEFVRTQRKRPNGRIENDGKWLCTCTCGMTTMAHATDLILGKVMSCGCLHRESSSARFKKHGGSKKERLYTIWMAMKQRCYYNKAQHRANYSMKGVTVCDDWKDDYQAFKNWAFSHGYYEQPKDTPHKDILSIDRIDPNGNYCPENCQWISCDENLRKRFSDERDIRCQRS